MSREPLPIGILMQHPANRALLLRFLDDLEDVRGVDLAGRDLRGGLSDVHLGLVVADDGAARRHGRALLALKWTDATPLLPILIALAPGTDGGSWLRAGFDDVLHLPLRKEELRARLAVFGRLRDQSERRYRLLFEQTPVGIYRVDGQGALVMANPALVALLGHDSFAALAAAPHGLGPAGLDADARAALDRDGRVAGAEVTLRRADGAPLVGLASLVAVGDGAVHCYDGTLEDITTRKAEEDALRAARAEAEAANRAKTAFLANMSHEIRTPLTSIIGFATMLEREVEGRPQAFAARIEKAGQRLLETLNAIITLAKLESDDPDIVYARLSLVEVVEETVEALRPLAQDRGLRLGLAVPPATRGAEVEGERDALASVLRHLVSNAIKYTPDGRVDVRVEPADGGAVRVVVEDTGIGIAPDFLDELFEPFRQESSGFGRAYEGNGLGLALAKRLTERMGGRIEVDSEQGRGSTFTIILPRAVPAAQDAGVETP